MTNPSTRLRQQAVYCNFANADEDIRDQVVDKCISKRLRRKLLEIDNLDLTRLQTTARLYERTEHQAQSMEKSETHKVSKSADKSSNLKFKKDTATSNTKCFRCGHSGHFACDPTCPAKGKKCNKCKNVGHFAKYCKWKKIGKVQMFKQDDQTDSDEEYLFSINESLDKDEKTEIIVGGKQIKVIVDSGVSVNIIGSSLWKDLKRNKIKCVTEKTDKKLYTYGSTKPLVLL